MAVVVHVVGCSSVGEAAVADLWRRLWLFNPCSGGRNLMYGGKKR